MTTETITTNTPATETTAPVTVISTPVSTAPTVTPPSPAPAPAAAVEATPVAPAAEAPKAAETLLAAEPVAEPNPAVTPPVEGQVAPPVEGEQPKENTEGGQSENTAPPPSYEAFKLPEGVSLEPERISKFTEILSELELKGKADHALVQEFGQKAVDLYVNEVQETLKRFGEAQVSYWERQKGEWKDQFLADPEIGGNRFQTTLDAARTFIRTHGGTAEQQAEFRNLMETSGLGNHPTMIRILAKAGAAMSEGKPLAATQPVSAPKSKTQTLYGGKS